MIPVVADGHPLVFAHRGGGDEAAENSSAAFDRMRALGVRHIETDVHCTRDGYVVIHHDDTVDRTYDGSGKISDLTWGELQTFRNEAGQRMQLLSEVLDNYPEFWLNIDAKSDDVVDPLLQLLDRMEAFDRVMLASFSEKRLTKIRRQVRGRVSTSLGMSAVLRLVAAAQSATAPGSWRIPGPNVGVRAVQVPHYYGPIPVVTKRFIAAAHHLGLAVHVWTINDPDEMNDLIDLGVDGLITDRPSLAKEILLQRGLWQELPPAHV